MGLQSQLKDVSSDSIPLFLVAIIAKSLDYLRSFLFSVFRNLRFPPCHPAADEALIGANLAGIIVLFEQRQKNCDFSFPYCCSGGRSICIVCRNSLKDGEKVRKLECRHVFHKECFDGWLDHLNFNCPICRRTLVPEQSVESTRRRVGEDLAEWFSLR